MDQAPSFTSAVLMHARLAARFLVVASASLVALLVLAGGPDGESSGVERLVMLGLAATAVIGVAVAWNPARFGARAEGVGAALTIGAGIGLGVIVPLEAEHNHLLAIAIYSAPFLVAGLLLMVCWARTEASAE